MGSRVEKPRQAARASNSKIAGAILERAISSSRSTGASSSIGIPHTCDAGTCLQVAKWGDDEESEVKGMACVACILGLHRREQSVDSAEVERAQREKQPPAKITFHPRVRIYKIQPYSEVYGVHPRDFDFDKYGNMQPIEEAAGRGYCRHLSREVVRGGVRTRAAHIDRHAHTAGGSIDTSRPMQSGGWGKATRAEGLSRLGLYRPRHTSTRIARSVAVARAQAISARACQPGDR